MRMGGRNGSCYRILIILGGLLSMKKLILTLVGVFALVSVRVCADKGNVTVRNITGFSIKVRAYPNNDKLTEEFVLDHDGIRNVYGDWFATTTTPSYIEVGTDEEIIKVLDPEPGDIRIIKLNDEGKLRSEWRR